MFGPDHEAAMGMTNEMGCVPRVCLNILKMIKSREDSMESELSVAYVEVYGRKVFNLLDEGKEIGANTASAQSLVLHGEISVPICDKREMLEIISRGESAKTRASK